MAKKKKEKIVIQDIELSPTVIGEIIDKKTGLVPFIIIIIILIGATIFLPEISNFIESGTFEDSPAPQIGTYETSEEKNTEEEEEVIVPEDIKYEYSEDLIIATDEFRITNFSYDSDILELTIENSLTEKLDFNDKNYFIEIYTNETTLHQRIILEDIILDNKESKSYSFVISETISHISIVEIDESDYPEVYLSEEDGISQMICSNEYSLQKISFIDNKIVFFEETINMSKDDYDYEDYAREYEDKENILADYIGVEIIYKDEEDEIKFYQKYDYEKINFNNSSELILNFEKDTVAEIVKFETEANGLGFKCE